MQKGDRAGNYVILDALGSGGEGSVYLGMHVQTHQLWALKVLAMSKGRSAFQEVMILRKLHHRSLPSMIEVIACGDEIILVMEYIRGKSLLQLCTEQHGLTRAQLMDTALQIGNALAYLHGQSPPILHLDIKPENVICQPDGNLVLVDFGASLKASTKADAPAYRKGTDGYAPPELYDPSAFLDERSDIYELGAMLYFLASGMAYSSVLYKGRVPGCDDALSEGIRHCLSHDRTHRTPSARALIKEFRGIETKRKRERKRLKVYPAILLCLLCLSFAMKSLSLNMAIANEETWAAGQLLEEALIRNADEGEALCKKALFLDPVDPEGYRTLIALYSEDGVLTAEEDRALRQCMLSIRPGEDRTYEEMLKEDPMAYGEVCSLMGYIYLFLYDSEDAQRIAGSWFQRAADSLSSPDAEQHPSGWKDAASIYARMYHADVLTIQPDPIERARESLASIAMLCDEEEIRHLGDTLKVRFAKWACEEILTSVICLSGNVDTDQIEDMVRKIEQIYPDDLSEGRHNDTIRKDMEEYISKIRSCLYEEALTEGSAVKA